MTNFKLLGPIFRKDGYEFMFFKRIFWLKVFYHNYTGIVLFKNEEEALLTNSPQKYSILSHIGLTNKINGKYEFILHWADLNHYVWWKQDNNPIYEEENGTSECQGFVPITNTTPLRNWGGLVKTVKPNEIERVSNLLDGNPGSNEWYFAIGMYEWATNVWHDVGIPAFDSNHHSHLVYLWLRYPSPFLTCAVKTSKHYLNNIFFVLIVSSSTE